jgi:hypothetical protein
MTRLLLVAVAIMLVPSVALAQTVDEETLLHQAYELRLAGHDEAALPLLERVYADDHSARVSAQLGLCEQALGHWMAADQHIRDALAVPTDPWVARHLDGLRSAHDIVVQHLAGRGADPETSLASSAPPTSPSPSSERPAEHHRQPRGWTTVQDAGVVTAGIGAGISVVGVGAWIAREVAVGSFNGAGCQIGDPNIASRCNESGAIAQRDTTTAMAASLIPVGAAAAVVGGVLFLATGAHRSHRDTTVSCLPALSSIACSF